MLASQSSPWGGLPRPRGPDGAAGRDAADPALSHPTFRLPVLLVVVAVPHPDEVRITTLQRVVCVPASILLHSPATLYLLWAGMCHYLAISILYFTHQLSVKTVI